MLKKRQQISIGVDVGSAFIKAVAIDKSKIIPELISYAFEPAADNKTDALKKAVSSLGFTGIGINTSMAGPAIAVRVVEMPKMTERELKGAVRFEAEKYIPYKIDEVITDCVKLEDLPSGKISILLVAAKKSIISERVSLFQDAGYTLNAVDVDSLAIMNAFLKSRQGKDLESTYALINIGAKITNLNIIRGQQTYLARDIQIAGDKITQQIARSLVLKNEEAEALKLNPAERKNDIIAIIKDALFDFVNELRFSFDFYESHYGKNIQHIYISGGSAKIEGLSAMLSEIFNGDVLCWDPFNNIKISAKVNEKTLEPIRPSFAVAIGLALRES